MIELDLIMLVVAVALVGVTFAVIVSLIPGLHVYSLLGFVVLFMVEFETDVEPLVFSGLTISMLIGYCLGSCISAVYFQTPDDSSVFMVFPSQKFLDDGRGYEAVYLTGLGAVVGTVISVLIIIFTRDFLVELMSLIVPHSLWIIATAMVFVWMSEWPKDPGFHDSKLKKLGAAWVQLTMGIVTLAAAGILGVFMFFSQLIPAERSFQGLAAAFVGLFAIPSLIQNLFTAKPVPVQNYGTSIEAQRNELTQGIAAGFIGGAVGMAIPALTAGVGNSFARHAVAQSGDRSYMFSQGLSRAVYYVGAVLLLFIPGVTIRRGGAALFISLFYLPQNMGELLIIAATAMIAVGLGWLVFHQITKVLTKNLHKINTRYVSLGGLIIMLSLTYWMLGISGIFVLAVATVIGAIPLVFNTRRVYSIAVITVPIMISMAGLGVPVSQFFGLL